MYKLFLQRLQSLLQNYFQSHNIVLPKDFTFPSKWEKHGDTIIFSKSAFQNDLWSKIDNDELWKMIANCLRVNKIAIQDNILSNDFRSPDVTFKLGTDPWVVHIDNRIKYTFNITKSMFSSGNITEKIRMGKLNNKGKIVVDLFTGIGYFSLPILVHGIADHVYSCEWNPVAVEALRKNVILNKCQHRCTVLEGDNRKVAPVGVADRVLLGLIPTAESSYETACKALKKQGGVLHVHHNVESKNFDISKLDAYSQLKAPSCNRKLNPAWLFFAHSVSDKLKETISCINQLDYGVKVNHIERVKSYAPHVDHVVVDIELFLIV